MTSPVRPWYRLHAMSWIAAVLVVIALVAVNLQPSSRRESGNAVGLHSGDFQGWPFWFAQCWVPRRSRLHLIQVDYFRLDALVGDVAVAVLLVLGATSTLEQWGRRQQVRFSLKFLLSAIAWCACVVAITVEWGGNWEDAMYLTANVIAYLALALSWLAAFHVASIAWK